LKKFLFVLLVCLLSLNSNVWAIEPPGSISVTSSRGVDEPVSQELIDAMNAHKTKCEAQRLQIIRETQTKIAEMMRESNLVPKPSSYRINHYLKLFLSALGDDVEKSCLEK
jgi:hypothetical protein